jgi:hypothetical protein
MRILERRLQRGTRETSLNVSRAFSAGVEPQRGGSDMGRRPRSIRAELAG